MGTTEHDFDRDMSIAECELIEEYLEGTLSKEERELFESHYLSSDEHKDLVHQVALLKKYSSGPAQVYISREIRVPIGPRSQYGPLAAAATIIIVGLLGLLSWRMFQSDTRPPLAQKYFELNAGDLGDLSLYPSLVLIPEARMVGQREPRFRADGPGTSILFRMPLEAPTSDSFEALIAIDGKSALRIGGLKVYQEEARTEVRLLIPRELLMPGQATIFLTPASGGAAIPYPFVTE